MTDPNGKPSFLAVDLNHLDPAISQLVKELLERVQQAAETTERADWQSLAHTALNRVYGDDEPDYSNIPGRGTAATQSTAANHE